MNTTTRESRSLKRLVSKPDLRTRVGREEEVITQIREHGGFSAWWITEGNRAHALERLKERGEIVFPKDDESRFPWCAARIANDEAHPRREAEGGAQ